ncbi:hypothetical protein ACG04R_23325 [Roseateles sp. BYS78W]|uniref:Fimbrial assembly protein n=1 Tax=Pelomonas candidula TaxID=3299025 RepID=A0ABW7HIF8_9BURK
MSAATIDFLHPRHTRWLGWVMLAAGAVLLAAMVRLHHFWTRQQADHHAAVIAQQQAVEHAKRDALKPAPPPPDQRRFQRIAPQLRQPWLPTLRLIEHATEPPVFLLALTVDPVAGSIRIDGEAPTFEQALSYVQTLDEPGFLGPAELRSHEEAVDPTSHATVRFTLVTRWSAQ